MKRFLNKWIIISLLLIFLFCGGISLIDNIEVVQPVYADSIKATNVQYDSIEKIIEIDENKVCNITEIITVTYKQDKINVGLSRNISRLNKITRIVNGKKYEVTTINSLELISVKMDDKLEYSFVEQNGDYFYINTGADYDYKVGQHVYKINYLYDMGEDFIDDFDDFTFDIMDYGFTNDVLSFSATIKLPKEFLGENDILDVLSFRINEMHPITYDDVNMHYDGDSYTITCDYPAFEAYHGLTMQLILPEDYFDTYFAPNTLYYVVLSIVILSLVGIIIAHLVNRLVRNGVQTVEFYPPEGYSPIDVANVYRGFVKPKDFASLILDWAARGLVLIKMKGRRHLVLAKLKEFENNRKKGLASNRDEKRYFDALFDKKGVYDTKEEKNKHNSKLNRAVRDLYEQPSEKKKKKLLFNFIIQILSFLPLVFFTIWSKSILGMNATFFFLLLFPIIAILVFVYMPIPIWFKLIWCGGFGGAPLAMLIIGIPLVYDPLNLTWIMLAIFLIGSLSTKFIRCFTQEELAVRGKVLGFKNFLVTAELDKLNMMLEQDPEYYYNILPYCYVFGITRKMEKKFQALHVENPPYCEGASVGVFCSHMSHSMSSIGGGSSFSGGSGGGSGGGGGGSSGGGGGGGGCSGR